MLKPWVRASCNHAINLSPLNLNENNFQTLFHPILGAAWLQSTAESIHFRPQSRHTALHTAPGELFRKIATALIRSFMAVVRVLLFLHGFLLLFGCGGCFCAIWAGACSFVLFRPVCVFFAIWAGPWFLLFRPEFRHTSHAPPKKKPQNTPSTLQAGVKISASSMRDFSVRSKFQDAPRENLIWCESV